MRDGARPESVSRFEAVARGDDTHRSRRCAMFSRRDFLSASVGSAGLWATTGRVVGADESKRAIGLGFSLYGMKSLPLADAVKACAAIGYDAVELPVMPDWPGDSAKLSADARREFLTQMNDQGLRLAAVMENLPALGVEAQHAANLERLKRACAVGKDLAQGDQLPIVETIPGGKPGEFDAVKDRLAGRLKEWAKVAEGAKVTVAIKAHVSNALQRPEQLLWLLKQVASPYVKGAYDYSHFELQGLKMGQTMADLLPVSAFVHVKDTR